MSGWDLPTSESSQHDPWAIDQPATSGRGGRGGGDSQTESYSTQEPRGGGRSFESPESSGWGQQRNDNNQGEWGNRGRFGGNQAQRPYGGGGGEGGNGRRNFDYPSNGSFGYRGGRGVGSMNWDRGVRGRGGGFTRGRGERGPGGWPNPQEYNTPPHAFNYQGNGSSSQWSGNSNRGGFDGGYPSFRGGYGGGTRGGFSNSPSFGRRDFSIGVTPVDFSNVELAPFERDFYKEHSKVAERSEAEVEEWRKSHSITISGGQAPKPVLTWGETKLPKYILEAYVVEKGYQAPTTIQSQSIPMALSGRDLIAISETGSGKTLAYAAPAIVHIAAQPPTKPIEGP
ncbi:hypothetical protein JCM3765_006280, partial [Sporobolomyces pararoseus]